MFQSYSKIQKYHIIKNEVDYEICFESLGIYVKTVVPHGILPQPAIIVEFPEYLKGNPVSLQHFRTQLVVEFLVLELNFIA